MVSLLKSVWRTFPPRLRLNLATKAAASVVTSFIDIVALILFAQLLSSLVLNDVSFLLKTIKLLGLESPGMKTETIYFICILTIIFLILLKSFLILSVNKRILMTLAEKFQELTSQVSENFFSMNITEIKRQSSYEVFLAINSGIRDSIIIGTSACINIVTEIIVVSVIFSILIIHGGISSFVLACYFILTFLLINKYSGSKSRKNSEELAKSNLQAAETVQAVIESFREIKVFNSLNWFLHRHQSAVKKSSMATVNLQFSVFIPKVVLESTFVIGIAIFTWFKIASGEVSTAVVEVGFLAAMGSRIIPSLLRLQFSIYQFKQIIGSSVFTMKLLESDSYKTAELNTRSNHDLRYSETPLVHSLQIENVSFTYPGSENPAISSLDLIVKAGESIGVVGRTGSGKSTLIDLLLGVIEPSSGSVKISGLMSIDLFRSRIGSVGFVPQSISLIDGTLRENLLLGRDNALIDDEHCRRALHFAGLISHIDSLELGLDQPITRAGSELSGGQRQKLGIARAVLTQPSILILDEVTSSLDAESESDVNKAISELHGKVTLIVVAHRLTTIKSMDRILLMENGRLAAAGSYDELIESNQTFKSFVELSAL